MGSDVLDAHGPTWEFRAARAKCFDPARRSFFCQFHRDCGRATAPFYVHASLIDEDEPFRFQLRLVLGPSFASSQNTGVLLLGGMRAPSFF